METVRIDKWLWAARFFKTRALASAACDIGRIELSGHRAKPSRDVKIGDTLRVTNEAGIFDVEVLQLSNSRGSAVVAQALYRESDASRSARAKVAEERKQMLDSGGMTESRPSKRDRRDIDRLRRGQIHRF